MRKLVFSILTVFILISCSKEQSISKQYFELFRSSYTGNSAYETTTFVEKYWRIAGNSGFNNSVYYIEEKLKKAGYVLESNATESDRLVYRIEEREMRNPTWEPVSASLQIVGQDAPILEQITNRNMVYLNSSSTPSEGVKSEVIHIHDMKDFETIDVEGKIVFAEMSPYRLYETAILEGGAIGLITYNNPAYLQPEKNDTSIQFRAIPFNKDYPVWGIALSYKAKEALKTELQKGSLEVAVTIETKIYPSKELTIIASIIGSELPEESLVMSAHIQEPGANDNATGVGVQLEMAELAASKINAGELDTKRTLVMLWGDEIISTRRYVKEKEKRNSIINWGLSLDMVGENTSITGGSFLIEKMPDPSAIWTRGKDKHSEWGGEVLKEEDMMPHYFNDFMISIFEEQGAFANWEVNTNPFEGGSDHIPFLKENIPGLLLWHFTDQFYHTDNDRLDKVSQETLRNVGTGALVSAFTLLNADTLTALEILKLLEERAASRIEDEFILSADIIKNGGELESELLILKSWNKWYVAAIQSVSDISNADQEQLKKAIESATNQLNLLTSSKIEELNNL
ncbi:DUF4910 domain-containing protein [Urechidicola sp. KH5]